MIGDFDWVQWGINLATAGLAWWAQHMHTRLRAAESADRQRERELSALKLHIAEHFVRQPDMQEVLAQVKDLNNTVAKFSELLHEIKGRLDGKSGG